MEPTGGAKFTRELRQAARRLPTFGGLIRRLSTFSPRPIRFRSGPSTPRFPRGDCGSATIHASTTQSRRHRQPAGRSLTTTPLPTSAVFTPRSPSKRIMAACTSLISMGPCEWTRTTESVSADFVFFRGAEFTSHLGSVELTLPSLTAFNLHADTRRGGVQSDFPLSIRTVGRRQTSVDGAVNGGGPTLRFNSHRGELRLRRK
jgi:hypothetical protein